LEDTVPVGGPPQGHYLNAVWDAETELAPEALLQILLAMEQKFGRERREKNGPRTLDLDILFYGDAVIDKPGLTIPHPRAHERAFVLRPMAALAPQWKHPRLHETMQALWEACLESSPRS
jgi:2-amino-4-hydroxy-6-hydroxymethyldihydropteridine diphosphokinase